MDAATDTPSVDRGDSDTTTTAPSLAYLLAGLLAGAGLIHIAMVPTHAQASMIDGIGFAAAGWFQIGLAGFILARRQSPGLYTVSVIGNLVLLSLYVISRTVGLPLGGHEGVVEDVGAIDGLAALCQLGAVAVAFYLLWSPAQKSVGALPILGGLAVLALATAVIVSPEAADHGHDAGESAGSSSSGGHDHGGGGGGDASVTAAAEEMALIDQTRCDYGFNVEGYWDEAAYLGVDTYAAGAMDASHHTSGESLTSEIASPSINGGRGSASLDSLVITTEEAGLSEASAGKLVAQLGDASDEEYQEWLLWMRSSAGGHGDHESSDGEDEGHGGHMGPQPWKAMVDESECAQLESEIQVARDVALAHPTAADAMADGWVRVTGYVPGIAAHYMNFQYVDGTFEVDKPEMILYDGGGPDARVVGLSYYVLHEAEGEPSQGFTGDNDHYHRHIGLCVGPGGVIGDSTTTDEECAAIGGRKQGGDAGWMSHAWVVPGCESPWGVFSAASPLLDGALADESGQNDGACSASRLRDRWDFAEGTGGSIVYAYGNEQEGAQGD
jgi:hypothetical protein